MPIDLKALAREGARQRANELLQEIAEIQRAFPGVATSRAKAEPATRKRRPMTPAERKAVAVRMKAYWAARRRATEHPAT